MSITVTLPEEREELLDKLTAYYEYESVDQYVSDLILYDVRGEKTRMDRELLSKKCREELLRRERCENEELRVRGRCSFCGGKHSPTAPRGLFKGDKVDICTNCLSKLILLLAENDLKLLE